MLSETIISAVKHGWAVCFSPTDDGLRVDGAITWKGNREMFKQVIPLELLYPERGEQAIVETICHAVNNVTSMARLT
jgi:hypothetical protein